jgi:hypothetical protein
MGAALLHRLFELRWASRAPDSRVVVFTSRGEAAFRSLLDPGNGVPAQARA